MATFKKIKLSNDQLAKGMDMILQDIIDSNLFKPVVSNT